MRRTVIRFLLTTAAFLLPWSVAPTQAGAGGIAQDPLAQARAATARYHDPANALTDGYVNLGPNPEEGGWIEFVNFERATDCTLDVTQPEALRYAVSGQGLRLVAVEYGIPFACASDPPEYFRSGIGDDWAPEPDVPVWTKTVWIWSGSSIGGDTAQ
jgi:hypothetical protein